MIVHSYCNPFAININFGQIHFILFGQSVARHVQRSNKCIIKCTNYLQVLGDEKKRVDYDQYGSDGPGNPFSNQAGGAGGYNPFTGGNSTNYNYNSKVRKKRHKKGHGFSSRQNDREEVFKEQLKSFRKRKRIQWKRDWYEHKWGKNYWVSHGRFP